jgi:hypothetical protein
MRAHARLTRRAAWRDGLSGISENFASRNTQRLTDDQARDVVASDGS